MSLASECFYFVYTVVSKMHFHNLPSVQSTVNVLILAGYTKVCGRRGKAGEAGDVRDGGALYLRGGRVI